MDEKRENNICDKCGSYDRYYLKRPQKFEKSGFGRCYRKHETVEGSGSCDEWHKVVCGGNKKGVATTALYDILNHLAAIRQIFEEDREER